MDQKQNGQYIQQEGPFVARHKGVLIGVVSVLVLAGGVFGLVRLFGKGKSVVDLISDQSGQKKIVRPELKVKVDPHDKDMDGVTDEQEAKLGTSDFEFDSDGDGLNDKAEIDFWKTDPSKLDTDGDGFPDGFEIMKGFNPNGEGKLK